MNYKPTTNNRDSMTNEHKQILVATINQFGSLCAEAQEHYEDALDYVSAAGRSNENAKYGAILDGGGAFEKKFLEQRTNYINRANESAQMGSDMLHQAFALIPPGCLLRRRYPQLMASIGTIPIPSLENDTIADAFFGDTNGNVSRAYTNDRRVEQKIGLNRNVLEKCAQICWDQQCRLSVVASHIRAGM